MTQPTEHRIIKYLKALGVSGGLAIMGLSWQVYKSGFNTYEAITTQLAKQVEINRNIQQQVSDLKILHRADIDKVSEEIDEVKRNITDNIITNHSKIR